MKELPRRTTGAVGVRSVTGRHSAHHQPSAATDVAVASERESNAVRVLPKLLRFPAVRERTGLSRSTIWRLERRGEFPKHHRITANVVAWIEEDVVDWIELRTGSVAS
jgi:prophage regulatory protein